MDARVNNESKLVGLLIMHRLGNPPHKSASIAPARPADLMRAFHQAVACHGQGRLREAEQLYEMVLAADNRHFDAIYRLGSVRLQQHRFAAAVPLFRRAVKIRKTSAEAHHQLGSALEGLGQLEEATGCYQKALAIRPDFAEAHNNLGHALQMLDRSEEAIAAFERAIAARPGFAEAHYNLGGVLHVLGRSELAIAQYDKALATRPNSAEARIGLGNALQAIGRLDEAVLAFEQAIAASPRRAEPYFSLANAKRLAASDRHFLAMMELARDMASLPVEEQTMMHFALGKACADVGDPQRSFRHLRDGNALKRRQIVYDEATRLKRFERIRAVFGAELMRARSGLGPPSAAPVFIFGMPRSGTTLVEQILASHPKVFGAGELMEMPKLAMNMRGADGSEFPERVAALSGEELRRLGASYLRAVRRMAPAAERITDKLPANFDLAGLIHLALPNARMIHVRRDPRDTATSCFSTLFTSGQEFSYDLAELGRYYRAYAALMGHWRQVLPEGVMLEVQYEEVVGDLEQQTRRMLAHCGLEWHEVCLDFHNTQRFVRTASTAQVRQPIYDSSVGRWRSYEALLQPLLQELGPI